MNEFKLEISGYDQEILDSIVKGIEELLKEGIGDSMTAEDIGRRIGDFGENTNINFYPSKRKGPCCTIAVFVSLKNRRGLALYNAWEELIAHMQGRCPQTELALFFTDSWDYDNYKQFNSNIKMIRTDGRRVYFILITQAGCTLLNA